VRRMPGWKVLGCIWNSMQIMQYWLVRTVGRGYSMPCVWKRQLLLADRTD
jgi:hypothetical protein